MEDEHVEKLEERDSSISVINVYRYDTPWWNGSSPASYYTTSLMECESLEAAYVKGVSPLSTAKWCPINWSSSYSGSGSSGYRRPVFKIVTRYFNRYLGETVLYYFTSREWGEKQLFPLGAGNRNKYLQLNEYHSDLEDGKYIYRGNIGAAYNSGTVDPKSNLKPVYLYEYIKEGKVVATMYTTDETGLTDKGWTKINGGSANNTAFYAYCWNYNATTETGTQHLYNLPWCPR